MAFARFLTRRSRSLPLVAGRRKSAAPFSLVVSAQMHVARLLIILVLGTLSLSSTASPKKDCDFQGTLDLLLANKQKYDQQFVCVSGIVHFEFEGNQLSVGDSKVWLAFFHGPNYTKESVDRDARRMNKWEQQFQDKCVVLRGQLNVKNKGHKGIKN